MIEHNISRTAESYRKMNFRKIKFYYTFDQCLIIFDLTIWLILTIQNLRRQFFIRFTLNPIYSIILSEKLNITFWLIIRMIINIFFVFDDLFFAKTLIVQKKNQSIFLNHYEDLYSKIPYVLSLLIEETLRKILLRLTCKSKKKIR